jgi:dTDP-4-amino-4,6-dideoxygalactose transaminase
MKERVSLQTISMVDLVKQYKGLKNQIDHSIAGVLESGKFINGPEVKKFAELLSQYLDVKHVIPCANGTDALLLSLLALDLPPDSQVITSAFSFIAPAEAIASCGFTPVFADIDPGTFNLDIKSVKNAITPKTKAIIPVHLFGQACDMEAFRELAQKYDLSLIEDSAQSLGCSVHTADNRKMAGTIGHMGCTSFFPTKNLGGYGDGGAVYTNNDHMAEKIWALANHGTLKKYHHEFVGMNSRLDTLQAAILLTKLNALDDDLAKRKNAAHKYKAELKKLDAITLPEESEYSDHTFNQFTIRIKDGHRDGLKKHLQQHKIPSMIYYPVPLHKQKIFEHIKYMELPQSEVACNEVLSLPMHPLLSSNEIKFISKTIKNYFSHV